MKTIFIESKFVVNEENGVTTCIIKFNVILDSNESGLYVHDDNYRKLRVAVGIAKCSKEDKFDEKLGKRIAESRAKQKVYQISKDITKDRIRRLQLMIKETESNLSRLTDYRNKEVKHEKDLLK